MCTFIDGEIGKEHRVHVTVWIQMMFFWWTMLQFITQRIYNYRRNMWWQHWVYECINVAIRNMYHTSVLLRPASTCVWTCIYTYRYLAPTLWDGTDTPTRFNGLQLITLPKSLYSKLIWCGFYRMHCWVLPMQYQKKKHGARTKQSRHNYRVHNHIC